jgi:hypothetical protein
MSIILKFNLIKQVQALRKANIQIIFFKYMVLCVGEKMGVIGLKSLVFYEKKSVRFCGEGYTGLRPFTTSQEIMQGDQETPLHLYF